MSTALRQERNRYSDAELNEFRELIQQKLADAQRLYEDYREQLRSTAENPDSKTRGLDDGTTTMENERLTIMASRQKKHIQYLQNALLRIQNKVYGVCRETGNLISKERLRAVPHATLSISAKKKRR